ncbi:hypothetical protein V6N13_032675 [Hibiscus sabdariffa]|uniref:Uncharacterized protein n=2 Tax=Hibiscus sabdariffa TaxID=183260 RepID=A0ABR1ZMK6_9ROSI
MFSREKLVPRTGFRPKVNKITVSGCLETTNGCYNNRVNFTRSIPRKGEKKRVGPWGLGATIADPKSLEDVTGAKFIMFIDFLKSLSMFGKKAPPERLTELIGIVEGQDDLDTVD